MAAEYVNVTPNTVKDNMGGTKQYILMAPLSYFIIIQRPKEISEADNPGETVEITTDHVMATGKKFIKIYCTLDKGMVKYNTQGERDGRSFGAEANIFVPGTDVATLGFMRMAKNDHWIILIPLIDGVTHQLGSEDIYAEVVGEFDSATNSQGVRGSLFKITSMERTIQVYSGVATVY